MESAGSQALSSVAADDAKKRMKQVWEHIYPGVLAVAFVVLIWFALSLYLKNIIPSPLHTFQRAVRILVDGEFLSNMVATVSRVLVGFLVAFLLSLIIGVLMGTTLFGERFFHPLVVVGLTIPGLMWAFISVMLFGLTPVGPPFSVAISVLPMLVINIWQGVKTLDRDLVDMSNVFKMGLSTKVRHIILPFIGTHMLAATRYGLGVAWKSVVVVEMFGASSGIGFQLQSAYQGFDMEGVLAWTLTFILIMILLEYGVLGLIERSVNRWRPKTLVWRR